MLPTYHSHRTCMCLLYVVDRYWLFSFGLLWQKWPTQPLHLQLEISNCIGRDGLQRIDQYNASLILYILPALSDNNRLTHYPHKGQQRVPYVF